MSVRAYQVKTMELEETPAFNVWSDSETLEKYGITLELPESGSGLIELNIAELESILSEKENKNPDFLELQARLRQVFDNAKKSGQDFIQFYCY